MPSARRRACDRPPGPGGRARSDEMAARPARRSVWTTDATTDLPRVAAVVTLRRSKAGRAGDLSRPSVSPPPRCAWPARSNRTACPRHDVLALAGRSLHRARRPRRAEPAWAVYAVAALARRPALTAARARTSSPRSLSADPLNAGAATGLCLEGEGQDPTPPKATFGCMFPSDLSHPNPTCQQRAWQPSHGPFRHGPTRRLAGF